MNKKTLKNALQSTKKALVKGKAYCLKNHLSLVNLALSIAILAEFMDMKAKLSAIFIDLAGGIGANLQLLMMLIQALTRGGDGA